MLVERRGHTPDVHPTAYVSPAAVVAGDVSVGAESCLLDGAVVTGHGGAVILGQRVVVMENAVVRGVPRHPARIGDHVLVGPSAYLTGAAVEDEVFVATGAALFNGCRVGRGSEVRIHGVVHVNTVLPPESLVPIGWVAVGDPARILPTADHDEVWSVQREMGFNRTVWGVERGTPLSEILARYTRVLRRQRDDRVVER